MKKMMICFAAMVLLNGCSYQEVKVDKEELESLKFDYAQLKESYDQLNEEIVVLLEQQKEVSDSSIFLIHQSEHFLLFSKRQYSDEIDENQSYIIKPADAYNGVQKLVLNFDSEEVQKINEQLEKNENDALNIYELNEKYFLKKAGFLWYDIEENGNIFSVTSNLYVHLLDAGRPGISYDTYNLNMNTGERLSNQEFLDYINIDLNKLYEILVTNDFLPISIQVDSASDLLIDKPDGYMGITFSMIDNQLVVTCSTSAAEQNTLKNMGKLFIPLKEIEKENK